VMWDIQALSHVLVAGTAGLCDKTASCLPGVTSSGDSASKEPRKLHAATGDLTVYLITLS